MSIGADSGGQGEASIPYTVAPNPVPSSRAGAIIVGAQSVAISQAAAPCVFTLSRAGEGIAAAGGRLAVDVTTISGCSWNAASGSDWIAVSSGQSGNASGTVGLAVAPERRTPRGSGEVKIAGQSYTVTQAAAPPSPDLRCPAPTAPVPDPPPAPRTDHLHRRPLRPLRPTAAGAKRVTFDGIRVQPVGELSERDDHGEQRDDRRGPVDRLQEVEMQRSAPRPGRRKGRASRNVERHDQGDRHSRPQGLGMTTHMNAAASRRCSRSALLLNDGAGARRRRFRTC